MLRVALGLVFLGFGVLKYLPGVSPAEALTKDTTDVLTLGLVPGGVSIIGIATLECFIGVCLILDRWLRLAVWLLAVQMVGILSPLAFFPGRLFAGPHHAPTLEGQYVLKDIILVGAAMVIAATHFRGGRLVRADMPPTSLLMPGDTPDAAQKLRLIADSRGEPERIAGLCAMYGISEAEFETWRDIAHAGAKDALRAHGSTRSRVPA